MPAPTSDAQPMWIVTTTRVAPSPNILAEGQRTTHASIVGVPETTNSYGTWTIAAAGFVDRLPRFPPASTPRG
jgi:hypothetical protein